MDVDTLCGQLIVGGYADAEPSKEFVDAVQRGRRGGAVLFRRNLPTLEAAWKACTTLAQAAPAECPLWLCVDEEGGRVSRLPAPARKLPAMLALAAHADEALIEKAGACTGRQLRALGFNLDLAPVLDVHTREDNPVIGDRAFGRDAATVARLGLAFWRGLKSAGIAGCGKHFPGHGDTSVDSHVGLPVIPWDMDRLEQLELVPFQAAVDAGIECLMSAHVVCEAIHAGVPGTLSPRIGMSLLRGELGFRGALLSDDLEMKAISEQRGIQEAAVMAVLAGCDAILVCSRHDWQEQAHNALVREARRSTAFRARCEEAVERTLAVRRAWPCRAEPTFAQALAIIESAQVTEVADHMTRLAG